jgi:hypothetical protein
MEYLKHKKQKELEEKKKKSKRMKLITLKMNLKNFIKIKFLI